MRKPSAVAVVGVRGRRWTLSFRSAIARLVHAQVHGGSSGIKKVNSVDGEQMTRLKDDFVAAKFLFATHKRAYTAARRSLEQEEKEAAGEQIGRVRAWVEYGAGSSSVGLLGRN